MTTLWILAVVLSFVEVESKGFLLKPGSTDRVMKDVYIVVLEKSTTTEQRKNHVSMVLQVVAKNRDKTFELRHEFTVGNYFKAYSAKMSPGVLKFALKQPHVLYVEPNRIIRLDDSVDRSENYFEKIGIREKTSPLQCLTQLNADWGLARTSQRNFENKTLYSYPSQYQGKGATVYVLDSGIYAANEDFENRATFVKQGADFVYNNTNIPDGSGHGTHVASLIIGRKYGEAKQAKVVAVRVADDEDHSTVELLMKGIEWVISKVRKSKQTAIMNMSMGFFKNTTLNTLVEQAFKSGLAAVSSAGNNGVDACGRSPASTVDAITVGASTEEDKMYNRSNHGPCINVFAPGKSILGAYITGPTSSIKMTGTSMAAALTSGILAKILSVNLNQTPAQLRADLYNKASPQKLKDLPPNTRNELVYFGC